MIEKIPGLCADAFILDLEDGVAPDDKGPAREHLREACHGGLLSEGRAWMLRVNGAETPWHEDDLSLAEGIRPPFVVLPKAENPAEVRDLAAWFAGHGSRTVAMIETARGVVAARELACAHDDVAALIVGSADLRASLGAVPDRERAWERHALAEILLAARAAGIAAFDGVYFHVQDLEGLRRHARIARDLGYDGKTCIHPVQLDVVREVFSSTPEEAAWARRVMAAWEAAPAERSGAIVVEGEMIEALHLDVARRILEREQGRS
jgi:citrate lyase beta subunit